MPFFDQSEIRVMQPEGERWPGIFIKGEAALSAARFLDALAKDDTANETKEAILDIIVEDLAKRLAACRVSPKAE